jgi:hypothetical protein
MTEISGVTIPRPATESPVSPLPPPSDKPAPFSPAERESFRAEDRQAAAAIVGVMVGIFALALVGYTIIAFVGAAGP